MKKTESKYDILKYVMAIMIIALHCQFVSYWGLAPLLRIAVPEFFILSSYFLFKKIYAHPDDARITLIKFIKRTSKLYLFWLIVLLPMVFYLRNYGDMGISGGLVSFFKDLLLRNIFPASWFLSALIIDVVICYAMRKRQISSALIGGYMPFVRLQRTIIT